MPKYICIILVLAQTFAVSGQVKKPVARYTFNKGTPEDEIGNNDARIYNLTPTEDRFGNRNSAYYFHGNIDSYMSLGSDPLLRPKKGTFSLWVKIEIAVYKGRGITSNDFIYTRAHDQLDFNEAVGIGYNYEIKKIGGANSCSEFQQTYLYSEQPSSLRKWYHVVLTYDYYYSCFYLNGILEAKTVKNFETCFLEGDSIMVGYHPGVKNQRFFMGVIDDIEIYDQVLSPKEVFELYNAPNPNKTAIVLRWLLIGFGIVVIIALIIIIVRWRVRQSMKIEQERNRLNARLMELETKALRSQMNPHFIFNSLNALQRFVLEERKEKTYEYLIEFSKLLRKMLESSEMEFISLQEEIEILNSYLTIEKQRFDNSFDYQISSDVMLPGQVHIPIMLVQPFVENAIWHGLLNKKGNRLLVITFRNLDDLRILCEVEDNGVGRNFKGELDQSIKKKSLGLDLIRQRLDLIGNTKGIKAFFEIIDKTDEKGNSLGTLVRIILPKMT